MIRNYIKIAFRNLWKERTFTSLNVIGLTAAFGVAILLTMYAVFQLSFDKFHDEHERIYQVYNQVSTPNGLQNSISHSEPFAPTLNEEVSGIEHIARHNGNNVLLTSSGKQLRMSVAYVDPEFLDVFTFPILKGNTKNPIDDESSVAITEHAANIIFGKEPAIGKTVMVLMDGEKRPFTVSAVLEDFPNTSSLGFDLLINFKSQPYSQYERIVGRWDMENHEVYAKLADNVKVSDFENKTVAFTKLHYKDDMASAKRDGAQPNANGTYRQVKLLPIADMRFANFNQEIVAANRTMPYLVIGISLLIICIACVNFINMSVAKSAQRLKEIGMRKTLGANRTQLFLQFWGESIVVFLVSIGLGCLFSWLLLDSFQTLFRTQAAFSAITNAEILILLIIGVIIITFLAGGYPAMMLSRLGTLQSLNGKLQNNGKNRVRNVLMVFQFGIAILLISGTLVLWNQIEFLKTKDLGFNKEQVIAFPLNGKMNDKKAVDLLRSKLENQPNISSITASSNILGLGKDGSRTTSIIGFDYKGRGVNTHVIVVDADYIETLDLELVKGRAFRENMKSDSISVIINESMERQLAEENVLNEKLPFSESIGYPIVGVVKDYNFQELDREIAPMTMFAYSDQRLRNAYIKVAPNNLEASYNLVKKVWAEIEPNAEFQGSFLNENIERTLRNESTMTTMIGSGSILAIVLSCIGLFAMSLLIVAQRRKEIGIRKVVGASVSAITVLLTKDFLKLVGIAFLIATPIAWWATSEWLQSYPYRMELNIWVFIAAGALALIIAIITISQRTISAAIANPVKSLRTE